MLDCLTMAFQLEQKRKKKIRKGLITLSPLWRTQFLVGLILIATLSILITALWYGTRITSLQIKEIEVVGGTTIGSDTVRSAVDAVLKGNYFHLIPHTFSPLYPKTAIEATVSEIPRVHNVLVERINRQAIRVVFDEYQPVALACVNESMANCYFLDQHGFVFAKAPELTGGALVRYVNREKVPVLKQTLFEESFMETTGQFINQLETELNLFVVKVIRADAVDTSYYLSTGAELKASNRLSPDETFTNLRSILTSKEFESIANGSFHYIDLRFGDKVFVSESELVATTTASSTPIE